MSTMSIRTVLFSLTACLLLFTPSRAQPRITSGTVALDADGTVRVGNHEGSITIEAWDRDEVKYKAVVRPESDADHPEATVVRVDETPGRFAMRTEYDDSMTDGGSGWFGSSSQNIMPVEYTLTVPRGAHVEIEDHESDIQVAGLDGPVRIDTHDGSVMLRAQAGDAEVNSHDGPITVEEQSGSLAIDTHDSRIRLRSIRGRTEIDAHDSRIEGEGVRGGLRIDTHEGEARLSFVEVTDDVEINTHDGDFVLMVSGDTGFDLHTDFDDDAALTADFDLSPYRITTEDEDKVNYSGQVNGGGKRLDLRAHDGSFEIRMR
ncbi:DUF4097 family beta strand repeat-containing protein [Salinibacter sp. 10B]|uniref:DUF4097 family beta strand repeat-containing protein n=1 Tax=Salinibacter sp. 10B TaxID=1923971 RepID=UPI000CF425AB|nr:DUF4097 family beta strand repeat-containing protein [Salinibacter sp. 10B]